MLRLHQQHQRIVHLSTISRSTDNSNFVGLPHLSHQPTHRSSFANSTRSYSLACVSRVGGVVSSSSRLTSSACYALKHTSHRAHSSSSTKPSGDSVTPSPSSTSSSTDDASNVTPPPEDNKLNIWERMLVLTFVPLSVRNVWVTAKGGVEKDLDAAAAAAGDDKNTRPMSPTLPSVRPTIGERLFAFVDISASITIAYALSSTIADFSLNHLDQLIKWFDPMEAILIHEGSHFLLFGIIFRAIQMHPWAKLPVPSNGIEQLHENFFQRWRTRREGPRSLFPILARWSLFFTLAVIFVGMSATFSLIAPLLDLRGFGNHHRDMELAMCRFDENRRLGSLSVMQVTAMEFTIRGLIFIHALRRVGVLPAYILSSYASMFVTQGVFGYQDAADIKDGGWTYAFFFRLTRSLLAPIGVHAIVGPFKYVVGATYDPMAPSSDQQKRLFYLHRLSLALRHVDLPLATNLFCQLMFMNLPIEQEGDDSGSVRTSVISNEDVVRCAHTFSHIEVITAINHATKEVGNTLKTSFGNDFDFSNFFTTFSTDQKLLVDTLTRSDETQTMQLTSEMRKFTDLIFSSFNRNGNKEYLTLQEWSELASLDELRHNKFNSACQVIATHRSESIKKPSVINDISSDIWSNLKLIIVPNELHLEKVNRHHITDNSDISDPTIPTILPSPAVEEKYLSSSSDVSSLITSTPITPLSILPYWQSRSSSSSSPSTFHLLKSLFDQPSKPIIHPREGEMHSSSLLITEEQRNRALKWYALYHTTEYESLFHYNQICETHNIDWTKVHEITSTVIPAAAAAAAAAAEEDDTDSQTDAIVTITTTTSTSSIPISKPNDTSTVTLTAAVISPQRWATTKLSLDSLILPNHEKISFELNGCTRNAFAEYVLKELKTRPQQTVEWLKRAHKVIAGQEAHPTQVMWKARTTENKA